MVADEIPPEHLTADLPEELAKDPDGLLRTIAVLAKPFFGEGYDHVVAARHCGRLYVGATKPAQCGCGETDPVRLRVLYVTPAETAQHGIHLSLKNPS